MAFPLAALFAALFAINWVEGDVRLADEVVAHFYDVRGELVELHSSLLTAETAVSGYLATGRDQFRQTFDSARGYATRALNNLAALVGNEQAGAAELREIGRLSGEELRVLAGLREQAPSQGGSRAPWPDREKALMADIEARVTLLYEDEERQLTKARYDRDVKRRRLFQTVMLCGVLGPLGALFVHLFVAGRLVRRIRGVEENARRLAHGLPLEPLPPGADEISALARQLDDAARLLREREHRLRESECRYRDLFDQAPIPYEETDRDGTIQRFNQAVCGLLRCSPDQIVGRRAFDFAAPDQQETLWAAMIERIASGTETEPFQCDYLLEDGFRISVEVHENLIRNGGGEVTGVRRSLLDVTERNLAAMAARKVEQYAMELHNKNEQLAAALAAARSATAAKSRFLAGVSHELRTPLNGIIGFSELMYDGKVGPVSDTQRDGLADILASARHLLRLINDILDLSKVEAGKMEFHPEQCRIQTLVEEVRDVLRPLADKKGLAISTEVAPDLAAVIDPSRFKQVLYNYLSNAVKFTPPGGSIRLRVAPEEHSCFRLEVEDTGVGIPPEEISRLFQEFQQLPNSRRAEQGTGLGLALTRRIVEAQGGTVAVRSKLGSGSVFTATLPLETVSQASSGN